MALFWHLQLLAACKHIFFYVEGLLYENPKKTQEAFMEIGTSNPWKHKIIYSNTLLETAFIQSSLNCCSGIFCIFFISDSQMYFNKCRIFQLKL